MWVCANVCSEYTRPGWKRGSLVCVSFIERSTRGSGVAHEVLLTFILRNKAEAAKQTQKPPAGKEGWWQRCRQRLIQEWSQVSITAKSLLCLLCASALFFWFGHLHIVISRWVPEPHRAPTGLDAGDVAEAVTLVLRSRQCSPWWQFVIRPQRSTFSRQITGGIYNINDGCILFRVSWFEGRFNVAHGGRSSLDSIRRASVTWSVRCCFVPSSTQLHIPPGASQRRSVTSAWCRCWLAQIVFILSFFFSFSLFVCYC